MYAATSTIDFSALMPSLPNLALTSSSIWDGSWPAANVRVNSASAWLPSGSDVNPWIQVDLGSIKTVTKVATYGHNI